MLLRLDHAVTGQVDSLSRALLQSWRSATEWRRKAEAAEKVAEESRDEVARLSDECDVLRQDLMEAKVS